MRISDWSSDVCSSDLHPAISRRSMYYNIHFLVAYYRVHALLTRKDRRGRASTDGTPRDWTDRDIKSLRPFRPDPSPPKVELWKRGLALALMVIVAVCTGIMIAMKVSLTPLSVRFTPR